jgi:LytS/YehU family sensor histidine kinase
LSFASILLASLFVVISVIFINNIFEIILLRKEMEYNRMRAKMEVAKVEAELEALKSQIDPHFIFNSLNTFIPITGTTERKIV